MYHLFTLKTTLILFSGFVLPSTLASVLTGHWCLSYSLLLRHETHVPRYPCTCTCKEERFAELTVCRAFSAQLAAPRQSSMAEGPGGGPLLTAWGTGSGERKEELQREANPPGLHLLPGDASSLTNLTSQQQASYNAS